MFAIGCIHFDGKKNWQVSFGYSSFCQNKIFIFYTFDLSCFSASFV